MTCCVRSERKTENLSSGWSRPLRNLQRKLGSALLGNVLAVLEYSAELGLSQWNHVKPIGTQVLLDLQSEKNMLDAKAHVFRSTRGSAMGATVRSTGRGWCRECLPQQGLWQPELRPSKWKFQAGQILVLPCRGVYLSDTQTQRLSDWKNQSWDLFLDKANLPLKNLICSSGYNQLLALPKGSHQAICFGQAWCSRLSSVCSVQRCRFHRLH